MQLYQSTFSFPLQSIESRMIQVVLKILVTSYLHRLFWLHYCLQFERRHYFRCRHKTRAESHPHHSQSWSMHYSAINSPMHCQWDATPCCPESCKCSCQWISSHKYSTRFNSSTFMNKLLICESLGHSWVAMNKASEVPTSETKHI